MGRCVLCIAQGAKLVRHQTREICFCGAIGGDLPFWTEFKNGTNTTEGNYVYRWPYGPRPDGLAKGLVIWPGPGMA